MEAVENRPSILVSACLLGIPCRYDGKSKPVELAQLLEDNYDVIPICPEKMGGLVSPRTPSEQQVIDGCVHVMSSDGEDRTSAFELGAQKTVEVARRHGCTLAVLKAKSPSCGTELVYDGTFSGTLVPGSGIGAQALTEAGVQVMSEYGLPLLGMAAKRVEATQSYPHLAELEEIFLEAFPPEEIMPFDAIMSATVDGRAIMYVYEVEDRPAALAFLLQGQNVQYLLYLAVACSKRGKGLGSAVLTDLRNVCSKPMALDIETLEDVDLCPNPAERKARLSFYQQNGFEPSGFQVIDAGIVYDNLCRGGQPTKEDVVSTMRAFYRSIEMPDDVR